MKLISRASLLLLPALIVAFGLFAMVQLNPGVSVQGNITRAPSAAQPAIASSQTTTQTTTQTNTQGTSEVMSPTITAVGRIELVKSYPVVLQVGGTIKQLDVLVGQKVSSGDLLLALDTKPLEDAVRQAEIGLEQAKISLQAVTETVDASTIGAAEADLLVAKEKLALVQAGPTKEELDAAKSGAAAAWSSYNILKAGPTEAEVTQSSAALKLAELDVQQAQRAYDEIKWRADAGMTAESAALQRATISYEAAKAAHTLLLQGATDAQLQSALSGAQSAQNALNLLLKQPTPADLAAAKAGVATADAALTKLKTGSRAGQIRSAELGVEQAQMALDDARKNLAQARVTAPASGVLMEVNARAGDATTAGTTAFVIADIANLQVVVNVEQRDLPRLKIGDKADVSVYGFGDKTFTATVERINPQGQSTSGPITFPVILSFSGDETEGLLPGMAATAKF